MAKLTGKKKAEFLKRMAAGRRRAKRKAANPKKRAAKKTSAKKRAAKRPAKKNGRLSGKAKQEFLRRMARGRKKAAQNPGAKKRGRRNPDDMADADAAFEAFHGKPPGHTVTYESTFQFPDKYAECGALKELRFHLDSLNPSFPLRDFRGAIVATTPDGSNLYFIGGDQSIDLAALGIESDKDMVELGSCNYIAYHTVKGFHDFAPTLYYHEFGEEDGIMPVLCYDRLNKALYLVSGNYRVRPEGIVN